MLRCRRRDGHLHGLRAARAGLGSPEQEALALFGHLLDFTGCRHLSLRQAAQRAAQLLLQLCSLPIIHPLHGQAAAPEGRKYSQAHVKGLQTMVGCQTMSFAAAAPSQ